MKTIIGYYETQDGKYYIYRQAKKPKQNTPTIMFPLTSKEVGDIEKANLRLKERFFCTIWPFGKWVRFDEWQSLQKIVNKIQEIRCGQ